MKLSTAFHAENYPQTPRTLRYSDIYPYKTPASFGKARRKVECALPMSPRKRTAVLATLAGGLRAKVATKAAPNSLNSPAVKAAIIDFYNNDSVSRMSRMMSSCQA